MSDYPRDACMELGSAIEDAVRRSSEGRDVAVAFSGGLDSGLVAALASRYAESVTCYTCGTDNAFDVRAGRELAGKLGLPWVHCRIGPSNIESIIADIIRSTGESDPFTISYELQLFCVCSTAKESVVLTGQGADEYFGGSAKFVGLGHDEFRILLQDGKDRLNNVSVPCEMRIAEHFGKELVHPYLVPAVTSIADALGDEWILPKDMDSRKSVLKNTAECLGYPVLTGRTKKSSQYGSGTTDLIRAKARENGMMYNEYIAGIRDGIVGPPSDGRGAVVSFRMDPVLKAKAERILSDAGITPAEAVESLYRDIVENGPPSIKR